MARRHANLHRSVSIRVIRGQQWLFSQRDADMNSNAVPIRVNRVIRGPQFHQSPYSSFCPKIAKFDECPGFTFFSG